MALCICLQRSCTILAVDTQENKIFAHLCWRLCDHWFLECCCTWYTQVWTISPKILQFCAELVPKILTILL